MMPNKKALQDEMVLKPKPGGKALADPQIQLGDPEHVTLPPWTPASTWVTRGHPVALL